MKRFIYSPEKNPEGLTLKERFGAGEELFIETEENVVVECFWVGQKSSQTSPTIMILHGNAGSIHQRYQIIAYLYVLCSANVFALSYRGYGRSTGKPSESGIKRDVEHGLIHLLSRKIDTKRIYLYGQSLGGACAFSLLEKHADKICGLIIENTFLSIPKVIRNFLPVSSFIASCFISDRWDTEKILKRFITNKTGKFFPKTILLSAKRDEMVPCYHMQKIFKHICEIMPVSRKKDISIVLFNDPGHNTTWLEKEYFKRILFFIKDKTTADIPGERPPYAHKMFDH
ncbi:MAG: BEM46 family protein [Amphiamblys sp. WSBS2006]|nr:MAG: BEM46 family protein [Amphiamblys sp. WSBS2006]